MIALPGALTGLPEYRNGGLFVDLGVIVPRRSDIRATVHAPGDAVIAEWRALTEVSARDQRPAVDRPAVAKVRSTPCSASS